MSAKRIKVIPNGQMNLPSDIRKHPGLSRNGTMPTDRTNDSAMLRTKAQAIVHAQAMSRAILGAKPAASVDDFIEERCKWQD